ncbi:MAG: polyprenyl synthetase family protein [Actinomycetota bacterium]
MSESESLLKLVQEHLDDFCSKQKADFAAISDDLEPLVDYTQTLLQGGKRFRALFCYWSWVGHLATTPPQSAAQKAASAEAMVGIGAALEMFHAAALVHDDLLDQSDTRRGQPAVHKRFESLHSNSNWAGSPERFGIAGSVLVGDLMLGWSSEIFGQALLGSPNNEISASCRDEFSKMRVEVMAGQYLDIVEENAAITRAVEDAVGRANNVILYKSAKYSIEAPLLIGAAFAGANEDQLRAISAFGVPLGMAFQLRDDVLGVFGDPAITGKPAGDDLREGKRTVLVGYTRASLSNSVGRLFDEMLSSRELTDEQVGFLQQTIIGSGALDKVERTITALSDQAMEALARIQIDSQAMANLRTMAEKVIHRSA